MMAKEEYFKCQPIRAERFHDTRTTFDDMETFTDKEFHEFCDRYKLTQPFGNMDLTFAIRTLEGEMRVHLGDWIATGVNGEHWPISNEIFQKTYRKSPMVPLIIGKLIRKMKANGYPMFAGESATVCQDLLSLIPIEAVRLSGWVHGHQEEFAAAWLLWGMRKKWRETK